MDIYIYLEEGPPFGVEDRADIPVRLAPILIVLNMVETSMFPWRRSWFFCTFGTHTRWENHKWYVSIVGGFLSCFRFTPFHVFGDSAARLWRSVVFLMPRVIFRARVERWVSFGQLPGRMFCVFFLLGLFFRAFGGPLCSLFARRIHKVTNLCQLAPPAHPLGSK